MTVANPATIPVTIPIKDGLPNLFHSINIQTNDAVAADICVTNIAIPAPPLAPKADPALKPNHPIHNIEAPIIVNIGLCGGVIDFGKPLLLPRVMAVTKAAVHGVGGIIGTLLVAFLATSTFSGLGLAEGQTGVSQFIIQLKAVLLTVVWTSFFTYLILKITSLIVSLRVDEQEEIEGLDLRSHGEKGYHSD